MFNKLVNGDVISIAGKLRRAANLGEPKGDMISTLEVCKAADKKLNLKGTLRCGGMKFERWLRKKDSPC